MRLTWIGRAGLAGIGLGLWFAGIAISGPATLVAIDTPRLRPAEIRFAIRDPAPWRAFVLTAPERLVVDISSPVKAPEIGASRVVAKVSAGPLGGGWSRVIFALDRPMVIAKAGMKDGMLTISLRGAGPAEMARAERLAPGPEVLSALLPPPPPPAPGKLRIVLDPGHGGVDPGAVRDGVAEKAVALDIAQALAQALRETGRYDVILTREDDRFIALDDRVAFARAAGAALFLSLHANTVAEADVSGAAIHVASRIASDPASAAMAVLENGSDRAGGAGASGTSDDVARALLDMAEPVTRARAERAAAAFVDALRATGAATRSRPLRSADFRVLRAPDMPSLLLELGFLSHPGDRVKLTSPGWQAEMAASLTRAIDRWSAADPDFVALMRD